jgi:hypothetical protein
MARAHPAPDLVLDTRVDVRATEPDDACAMFEPMRPLAVPGAVLALTAALTACATARPPAKLNAQGIAVRVSRMHPSPNARVLGPVEGESGNGCAGFGTIGTYEAAEADLRNRTAAMGGDYVEIRAIAPPHDTGTQCPDNRMVIRGVAYKTVEAPAEAAASSPLPRPLPPPPSPATACDPACSPGYTCDAGTCVALCNPPCGPGQVCRADRLCVPGG